MKIIKDDSLICRYCKFDGKCKDKSVYIKTLEAIPADTIKETVGTSISVQIICRKFKKPD